MSNTPKAQIGMKVLIDWDGPSAAIVSKIRWDGSIELTRFGGQEKIVISPEKFESEVQETTFAKWKEILS